jgi:hypothetical protein
LNKDTDGRQVYKKLETDLKKEPIYPYLGDASYDYAKIKMTPPENPEPYTEADYIAYKATKEIPKHLKKEIKKKKKEKEEKENIEITIEEVKPEKKEKIIYNNKSLNELNESERKAYDYINERNIGQSGSNVIPYSKIPQIISIRNF